MCQAPYSSHNDSRGSGERKNKMFEHISFKVFLFLDQKTNQKWPKTDWGHNSYMELAIQKTKKLYFIKWTSSTDMWLLFHTETIWIKAAGSVDETLVATSQLSTLPTPRHAHRPLPAAFDWTLIWDIENDNS